MVVFALAAALAAPPSSSLSGDEGTLTWTIESTETGVSVAGKSPKWTVAHTAKADFTPVRTERTDAEGKTVVIDYGAEGATVHSGGKTHTVSQADLWDGDTLDVRLGHLVSTGRPEQTFHAYDPGSDKVYRFDSQKVGAEQCGAVACTHVLVQLTGLLRWVGPSWNYWYSSEGELLKFEGPAGDFAKNGG